MNSQLVIAHISDLHYPHWDEGTFLNLKNYLRSKEPNLILVTGDLVDQPWPKNHANVRARLLDLVRECDGQSRKGSTKLAVVPGNHDYAIFGNWNLGTSPFWIFSFRRCFKSYNDPFFEYSADGLNVLFFCLNSNPLVAKWARGLVSRRQLKSLEAKVNELRGKDSEKFDSAYKIAILHHHPLPIPHSEELEQFLILKNAGEVLRVFAQCKINLVLHGHKHDSVVSSINLGTAYAANLDPGYSTTRRIFVVASGSTLKKSDRENTCNIITIRKPYQAEVLPVGAWPGSEFVEKTVVLLPSWDDYVQERYQAESRRLGYEIDEIKKHMVIDDEGDGYTRADLIGIRVNNQRVYQKMKDPQIDPFSVYTETGRIQVLPPDNPGQRAPEILSEEPRRIRGKLGLPDHIDPKDPLSINFRVITLNAWALNEEEFRRKYFDRFGPQAFEEEWYVATRPVRSFHQVIQLPQKCKPSKTPELRVYAPVSEGITDEQKAFADKPEEALKEYYRAALIYDERRNTITLNLKQPLIGYKYAVHWLLPPASARAMNQKYVGETDEFMARVNNSPGNVDIENVVLAAELLVREELRAKIGESIDVSLAVATQEPNATAFLRVVADNQGASIVSSLELEVGDGLAGRAYRLNELIFYEDKAVTKNPKHVYVPFGRVHYHKVLCAIPLRHPIEPELVIGVLTVGSPNGFSSLIPTPTNPEASIIKSLVDIAQGYVVKSLDEKVGHLLSWPDSE
jgi:predicted MPP superfamily phosphohydrolase